MQQRLYDSKTQTVRDFSPLNPGCVSMYVCGPTVQSAPHIGHLRSALVYDQIRRWFEAQGLRVTLVRNVTDIDDKTLANATEREPWWALAYRVEGLFTAAYDALGVRRPTYEPRATASIGRMQEIIAELIQRGHAYPAEDGSGDVYFDTASWADYGELTHQRPADMEQAPDGPVRSKRNPQDFALWKGRKADEPADASWASPWGEGRPGWHIECSAMSTRYLGEEFDIHGGGRDLRFPHHENELAQSRAAGHGFARYWMHNGLVSRSGQKMSKSIGNTISADELMRMARPIEVRYLLGSAHYRSTIEVSPEALAEAAAAFARIEGFLKNSLRLLGEASERGTGEFPPAFTEAMLDDFAVPQALAVIHDEVTRGNQAIDAKALEEVRRIRASVSRMLDVLGIDPEAPEWQTQASVGSGAGEHAALDALVTALIAERAEARASRDFARADAIRDQLTAAGIVLEDGADQTHWSVQR